MMICECLKKKQLGQSMVEYTVVLIALSAGLISLNNSTSNDGAIGMNKSEEGTLIKAVHDRYEAQSFAIRISDLPERNRIEDLSNYYKNLEKYPTLRNDLLGVAKQLNNANSKLSSFNEDFSRGLKFYEDSGKLTGLSLNKLKEKAGKEVKNQINKELKKQPFLKPFNL